MSVHDQATEAAALWDGSLLRMILNRENAVFEMMTPQGRAALRLHRMGYQDDAAIASELWWCGALSRAGVSVPAALTGSGGLLATLSNGRKASAIAWAEGQALGQIGKARDMPLPRALDLYHRFGALLAQVHEVTDGLTLPAGFTRPSWDIGGLVGEAPFWGRFWDHPQASPDQRALLIKVRAFVTERLENHQAAGGSYGLIHADLLPENVLVAGETLSLIDFDDCGFGFRLHDLGTALLHSLLDPAYPAIRDALMAGYGTQDREMVDTFALARSCASVGWTMPRLTAEDPINFSHIARACHAARAIMG